ncbi:hypothetical protein ACOME3_004290 [Neoechinorhynchus agilis]
MSRDNVDNDDKIANIFEDFDFSSNFPIEESLTKSVAHYLLLVDKLFINADYALRKREKPLIDTYEHLSGLCMSAVLSNSKVFGFGIYLETNNGTMTIPFAHRQLNTNSFDRVVLLNMLNRSNHINEMSDFIKKRRLEENKKRVFLKWSMATIAGRNETPLQIQYVPEYPIKIDIPEAKNNWHSRPRRFCEDKSCIWVVTYSIPIFLERIKRRGFLWLDAKMNRMDINQCETKGYSFNPFAHTNHCDRESSKCVPLRGHGLKFGAYKCQCRPGYEYPFYDQNDFFTGWQIEMELFDSNFSYGQYDTLKCRVAGLSTY